MVLGDPVEGCSTLKGVLIYRLRIAGLERRHDVWRSHKPGSQGSGDGYEHHACLRGEDIPGLGTDENPLGRGRVSRKSRRGAG